MIFSGVEFLYLDCASIRRATVAITLSSLWYLLKMTMTLLMPLIHLSLHTGYKLNQIRRLRAEARYERGSSTLTGQFEQTRYHD